MSHAHYSALSVPVLPPPVKGVASEDGAMSTVVYRSRAVKPLSESELYDLALAAQARNRQDKITGLVLYDNSRFFQWLEGPTENISRIMAAIRSDPRHTDVEILNDQPARSRSFADWDMKLAARSSHAGTWTQDVLEPPIEIVEFLRQRPEAAPALLLKLVPLPVSDSAMADPMEQLLLRPTTASVLKAVLLTSIVPALLRQRGIDPSRPAALPSNPLAADLAELLIGSDEAGARQLIEELASCEKSVFPLYGTLFEPAARVLGDLWNEDLCSEFDVTLGLCRMQTAVRLLSSNALGRSERLAAAPAVLIVPEPGELHRLGSALDSEVLWNAGWVPRCAYPEDDRALQDLVADRWFDVLDLSLSTALQRAHWLPRVATTIKLARRASLNPGMLVVVGGRIFAETRTARMKAGADRASTTSLDVRRLITESVPEMV